MKVSLPLIENDSWLEPYSQVITTRIQNAKSKKQEITGEGSLADFANGYLYFGLHKEEKQWIFREWAPNAEAIFIIGDFTDWKEKTAYKLNSVGNGVWELKLPVSYLHHKNLYRLSVHWQGGAGDRIPAWATRVVQDSESLIYNAQVWDPSRTYSWKNTNFQPESNVPLIYEAHIGMATEKEKVGTYQEFRLDVLPHIIEAGYNTIQLMAIQEHPYYGSFGYHVSNFFAASSRFGTPEDLKALIDDAHKAGISVIMDLVHSHSVKNELEGLGRFDGTSYQYFHDGIRGLHPAWDSLCFNYGKNEVLHFLLSNCKYWLDEYHFDGFRFDGVTSMIYYDHGLSRDFNSYDAYFDGGQDEEALTYLWLANKLILQLKPGAFTIAEEMSGMPGLATSIEMGGYGFTHRLAMGIPDYWIKLIKEVPDEKWNVDQIFFELSNHRVDEKTIAYSESHDQALVGDKTIIFRLLDKDIYFFMNKESQNLIVERGIALHKLIRLISLACCGGGYLNFMGNEFGHPEWIDFPREGNQWSYKYARRQWSLLKNQDLRYHLLYDFDKAMLHLPGGENIFEDAFPYKWLANESDQVLAFTRGDFLFLFNFNPNQSFQDYGLNVPTGKYKLVLNTDSPEFGGFGNISENQIFFTKNPSGMSEKTGMLYVYLPSRTALVLERSIPKGLS
ncbi:MAG: alpha amylase C-terminal domain-containing protein [Bacteroidota bacterium]|nr:alpha amylase C-terminal domain-containing protein [Bacteroidota bacterium]